MSFVKNINLYIFKFKIYLILKNSNLLNIIKNGKSYYIIIIYYVIKCFSYSIT